MRLSKLLVNKNLGHRTTKRRWCWRPHRTLFFNSKKPRRRLRLSCQYLWLNRSSWSCVSSLSSRLSSSNWVFELVVLKWSICIRRSHLVRLFFWGSWNRIRNSRIRIELRMGVMIMFSRWFHWIKVGVINCRIRFRSWRGRLFITNKKWRSRREWLQSYRLENCCWGKNTTMNWPKLLELRIF